jgi:hypothetical protein
MMRTYSDFIDTTGDGLWSTKKQSVDCIGYEVYGKQGDSFGELRVYFDTRTWNVENDGLIYTDSGFLAGVRDAFVHGDDIDYSEQGMQGDDFVSFDVGAEFLMNYGE